MSKFAEILKQMALTSRKVEVPYYSSSGFKYLIRFNQCSDRHGDYMAPPISVYDADQDGIKVIWANGNQESIDFPSIDALAGHLGASFSMESVEANNE